MAIELVQARCRTCATRLVLAELVLNSLGTCPGCGEQLAPGYTLLLLEETRNADSLQRALVMCLHRLLGLPGTLELSPKSGLEAVLAVDWHVLMADDREIIRGEVAELRPRVSAWGRLARHDRPEARTFVAAMRRLAQRLRRHGQLLDEHDDGPLQRTGHSPQGSKANSDAVWHAAMQVEHAVDAVSGDRLLADDIALAALQSADACVRTDEETAPGRPLLPVTR